MSIYLSIYFRFARRRFVAYSATPITPSVEPSPDFYDWAAVRLTRCCHLASRSCIIDRRTSMSRKKASDLDSRDSC